MKFVMALLALAAVAQGARQQSSPIGKVLELVGDLEAKILKEGEAAQKLYAEFSEWCEDRAKNLGFEIKTGKAGVESLQAAIAEEVAASSALETKIEELASSIATDEADLKAAMGIRAQEAKDFVAEEKELTEVIDTLERATRILERELAKHGAAFVQLQNVQGITQALSVLVQASALGAADAAKLTALVQSSSQDSDGDLDAGAPAAAVYEGSGGGIVDVLQDLLEKAEEQLAAARQKETTSLHNFEMLAQSLTDEARLATKDLDEAKKAKAASAEKKATAEGELGATSKELAADIEAKASLHHDCMTKAEEFEAETKSRGEELAALANAKEVLQDMTNGADAQTYGLNQESFVQVASKITSGAGLAQFEAARFVRDLAHKHGSTELAQLAVHLTSVANLHSRTGEDIFGKVKGLIMDMVEKLEAEAETDATHKAYCDKELAETNTKKDEKTSEIEKVTVKIDQMSARSSTLKEEIAALEKALSKLAASQAEMDKLRAEEKDIFDKNKAEMEEGLDGVKLALKVLREYYASEDKAHAAADGAGGGIVGLLEVVESDFSKGLAEMISVEEAAVVTYEKETKENEIEKATKEQDVKYKTKESTDLDKAVAEASNDRSGVQAELDAIMEYLKKIEQQCIAKAEAFEERAARFKDEIEGLKQALQILENEAAFIQKKSRRTLRGVQKHVA